MVRLRRGWKWGIYKVRPHIPLGAKFMAVRSVLSLRRTVLVSAVSLCWPAFCFAAEITSVQARKAVDNWLRREPAPLNAKLGGTALPATTYRDKAGTALFNAVPLKDGGLVVTSADDGIEPIIAISEGNNLVADAGNPLWVLLNKDMAQRRDALKARRAAAGARQLPAAATQGSPESEWTGLLDDRQADPLGVTSISDVRVAPIVQSHWGQSTVSGFWGDYNCYNYYTPNNYLCGCVATAMAQIMRNHCFPTSSVPAQTFTCSVNGTLKPLTMLGGVYNWSNMMLLPDEGGDTAPSTTIRSAIGKLCYDAGVSVEMQYGSASSGAYSRDVPGALVDVFGYASASQCGGIFGVGEDEIRNAILVNLDHGYPVYLGITGEPGGHAVVADGYGFNSGTRYIHLNVGWNGGGNGGYQNAWYNVPTVDTAQGTYSVLQDIVYNIIPDKKKMLVSGRVLDYLGDPVANVTVYVRDSWTGEVMRTLKTNSKGVYVFSGDASEDWMWYAGVFASTGAEASDEIFISADINMDYWPGNVWGCDLQLVKPACYWVELSAYGGTQFYASVVACVGEQLPGLWFLPPSRPGYEFMGFFDTQEDGWGTQYYDASLQPTPNAVWHDSSITVLYAHWRAVAVGVGGTFVPYSWFDQFRLTGGYENAALKDQDGDGHLAWQEYVAGSNPTNRESVLRTLLGLSNCVPRLTWTPDLGNARVYTVEGKTNLTDAVWGPTNAASRFFRVRVDMPQ